MSVLRERAIWDARARDFDLEGLKREQRFVAEEPLWQWATTALGTAGTPTRLLDVGCGRGSTTGLLAPSAGFTAGVDISTGSLVAAQALSADLDRPPSFAAASLEQLPFTDQSFDVVVGRFVLHHAESLEQTGAELARVMAPGGRAVFAETWGKNPLLRFGRDIAELWGIGFGTPDERPLRDEDLKLLERWFTVETQFPVFAGFRLLDRLFRRTMPLVRRSKWARRWIPKLWQGANRLDDELFRRLPPIRSWGWFVGVVLVKRPL